MATTRMYSKPKLRIRATRPFPSLQRVWPARLLWCAHLPTYWTILLVEVLVKLQNSLFVKKNDNHSIRTLLKHQLAMLTLQGSMYRVRVSTIASSHQLH